MQIIDIDVKYTDTTDKEKNERTNADIYRINDKNTHNFL